MTVAIAGLTLDYDDRYSQRGASPWPHPARRRVTASWPVPSTWWGSSGGVLSVLPLLDSGVFTEEKIKAIRTAIDA
ncbi:hypothetical protein SO3561_08079 [Streptomyces olivochromogenes]|uniref:Uncharacterized protein n=1 Tax=Streptomyces olivochromogenes TaxID=1963 RepID=A0A250VQU1_STROL|nr:hypothetical protein SO3561_08079 [Streptomyces olivochromogenes]